MSKDVYWDSSEMQRDGEFPSILAIGDSWFWYPFPGGSLLSQLGPLLATKEHKVLTLGENGADALDYMDDDEPHYKMIKQALRLHGSSLSAVLLSGGGNDFAGFKDFRPLLKADCSTAQSAADCFKTAADLTVENEKHLAALLLNIEISYRELIGDILGKTNTNTKIFVHNYDIARPTGIGVANREAWLLPALRAAKVPGEHHQACVQYVMKGFSDVLQKLLAIAPGRIYFVDGAGTLSDAEWANEIHPTPDGFKRLALEKWLPILRQAGLAT